MEGAFSWPLARAFSRLRLILRALRPSLGCGFVVVVGEARAEGLVDAALELSSMISPSSLRMAPLSGEWGEMAAELEVEVVRSTRVCSVRGSLVGRESDWSFSGGCGLEVSRVSSLRLARTRSLA